MNKGEKKAEPDLDARHLCEISGGNVSKWNERRKEPSRLRKVSGGLKKGFLSEGEKRVDDFYFCRSRQRSEKNKRRRGKRRGSGVHLKTMPKTPK